jgi:DNA-binding LacI/PurR family transcriptional regulator
MMMYSTILDVSHEVTHEEVVQFATEHGCDCVLLEAFGPAGGNPLYRFGSDNEDMILELADQLTGGGGYSIMGIGDPIPMHVESGE